MTTPAVPRRSYTSTGPYVVVHHRMGDANPVVHHAPTVATACHCWMTAEIPITEMHQAFVIDIFGQAIIIHRHPSTVTNTLDQFAMTEEADRMLEWLFPNEPSITELSMAAIERDVYVNGGD